MIHVEVVPHFNEDAFSHGLAQGLADRLTRALRDLRCPDHHDEPRVRVSTEGVAETVNELHVDVSGCCPAVVERVQEIVASLRDCDEGAEPRGGI